PRRHGPRSAAQPPAEPDRTGRTAPRSEPWTGNRVTTPTIVPLHMLQAQIRACTRCVEAGYIPQAAPILRGNATARVMVIGQAPGPTAAERPWPYSGSSGKTLQMWLARAGFEDGALHDP